MNIAKSSTAHAGVMSAALAAALAAGLTLLLAALPQDSRADVLEARLPANTTMASQANANTAVLRLVLPAAGTYAAMAKTSIVNWTGQEDYVRCGIALGSTVLDVAVTVVGGAVAPSAATMVSQARVTTTAANQVVSVSCSHDHTLAGIYVDGGASLLVSSAPTGPRGDTGAPGPLGAAGQAGSTYGVCASVTFPNPTGKSCACPAGKTLSQVQAVGSCSAQTQVSPCSANGYAAPGGPGSPVYPGACCVCQS